MPHWDDEKLPIRAVGRLDPGLKPHLFYASDAALKDRSSTCQILHVSFRRNALDATSKGALPHLSPSNVGLAAAMRKTENSVPANLR